MAVQSLKPRIDMMKARYGDDKNKIQRETSILYEQAGVNPLAGESSWYLLCQDQLLLGGP
jgi:YidC/Oxa1 family membrane protein insertase